MQCVLIKTYHHKNILYEMRNGRTSDGWSNQFHLGSSKMSLIAPQKENTENEPRQ